MTHPPIAAPLAAALAARGYETLTAVQQAVLDPALQGRDLLVSAQTGSGKTVAFGIAAAPDLLGDADHLPEGGAPLALAIAPTRELALQVAAELGWLYAGTGARIATCVGGMDYRQERRALERGAQIVVGTPGRLRDHIERGGLDLSALRVAVLDEADEMLDLGFREDLEFILQAAPEGRRTLMFSATVPAAIEKLARDFQRDSLRVAAGGEARQHGDIAYRALSVMARDRENAIFNLLRFYEARTAIVFCKTRANVNHLLARMGNRGFRVVALSGELSQQERTHALQALRDGRARVCIATDVAARGIDLPGLELVIHADLPTNSETLLHRSGRTGRAGAKGVSALIVAPSEYKKAQRLLQGAKVSADWGRAPSAEEVSARDDLRMLDHPALATELEDMGVARDLLARVGAEQIAAAFVQLWREGRPPPEVLGESPLPGAPVGPKEPRDPREFGASVWFSLPIGRAERAEARWLLPKICEAAGLTRKAIGAIRVRDGISYVQIAETEAALVRAGTEIGPGLPLTRMEGEPGGDAFARPAPARPTGPRTIAPRKDRAGPSRHDLRSDAAAAPAAPAAAAAAAPAPDVQDRPSDRPARPARPRAEAAAGAAAPESQAEPRPDSQSESPHAAKPREKARWTTQRKADKAARSEKPARATGDWSAKGTGRAPARAPAHDGAAQTRPALVPAGSAGESAAKSKPAPRKDAGKDSGKAAGKGPGKGSGKAPGKGAKASGKPAGKAFGKGPGKAPRSGGNAPPRRPKG